MLNKSIKKEEFDDQVDLLDYSVAVDKLIGNQINDEYNSFNKPRARAKTEHKHVDIKYKLKLKRILNIEESLSNSSYKPLPIML